MHIVLHSIPILRNLFSLLATPNFHYQIDGKKLDSQHLHANRKTEDGNGLLFFEVLHCFVNHLLSGIITVEICNGVVVYGVIEELGFDPAGGDSEYMNFMGF